jgi:hypothetical protein
MSAKVVCMGSIKLRRSIYAWPPPFLKFNVLISKGPTKYNQQYYHTGVSEIKSKNRLGAMAGMALTFNRP